MDIRSRKRALRRERIALWESIPPEAKRIRDRVLLDALSAYSYGIRSVFIYIGSDWEIETLPFIIRCLNASMEVSVPLCAENGQMTARRIVSISDLTVGHYGLMEPSSTAPIVNSPELAVLPGVAFSCSGYRLGRGMGYYDRWLASHPHVSTVALCPADLLCEVPHEEFDFPVQTLLTPDLIRTEAYRVC